MLFLSKISILANILIFLKFSNFIKISIHVFIFGYISRYAANIPRIFVKFSHFGNTPDKIASGPTRIIILLRSWLNGLPRRKTIEQLRIILEQKLNNKIRP